MANESAGGDSAVSMLKIEQLNQYYGQSHTLWDLDLEVPEGQCTVLMGRNGVGKTTLLNCIMGLQPIRAGSIEYGDLDLRRVGAEQRASLGIGYVPQGRQIFPLLSVEENLLIGLPARRDGLRRIPGFIFEMFPVLHQMLAAAAATCPAASSNSWRSGGPWSQTRDCSSWMNRPRVSSRI